MWEYNIYYEGTLLYIFIVAGSSLVNTMKNPCTYRLIYYLEGA